MTKLWYYVDDHGETSGPVSFERLIGILASLSDGFNSLVWIDGMPDWEPAFTVPIVADHLRDSRPPTPPPRPAVDQMRVIPTRLVPVSDEDSQETHLHPWQRFFARQLDLMSTGILFGVAESLLGISNNLKILENSSAEGLLVCLLNVPVETFMIATFGTTFGKLIYGIRLTKAEGMPIDFHRSLWRAFTVYIRGLGLGIPFVSLFTFYTAYSTLKRQGKTSWDLDGGTTVSHSQMGWARIASVALVWCLFLAVIIAGTAIRGR